jgi:hypothetical protein
MMNPKRIAGGRKAQVFSLDVLVSLVPILMVLGAGMQYLFNIQEDSSVFVQELDLDSMASIASDYIMSNLSHISDCERISEIVRLSGSERVLPDDYVYFVQVRTMDSKEPRENLVCNREEMWSDSTIPDNKWYFLISMNRNTTASYKRFMLGNTTAHPSPGNVTEVSVAVWKK